MGNSCRSKCDVEEGGVGQGGAVGCQVDQELRVHMCDLCEGIGEGLHHRWPPAAAQHVQYEGHVGVHSQCNYCLRGHGVGELHMLPEIVHLRGRGGESVGC